LRAAPSRSVGVEQLLRQAPAGGEGPLRAAVYVGDDVTDLDAFHALRAMAAEGELQSALCVAVRSEESPPELVEQADLVVDGQSGVRGLLEALL
jgi:trehalose 6-phosphate phosphatase